MTETKKKTKKDRTYRTKSGRDLTNADIKAMADEVERTDYDVDRLKTRRGRPLAGTAPTEVFPVRLDPELRRSVQHRAEAEETTASEVIRRALRAYLEVA